VPTIPIEIVFAPMVVIPPCARNAWKKSEIIVNITVANGPTMIEDIGVPIGWEQEPVTGTGMCHTDIMKTADPTSASIGMYDRFSLARFLICHTPTAANAIAIAYQMMHHSGVSIPSDICMSDLG